MKILTISMDSTTYGTVQLDGSFKYDRSQEIFLAEEFQKLGHEVTLVTEREVDSTIPDRLVAPVNSIINYQDMNKILSKQYDIVFTTSVSGAHIANFVAKKQSIPSVVELLDIPYWRLHNIFLQFPEINWRKEWDFYFNELKKATHVIVNTTPCYNSLLERIGNEYKNKVSLVYYGVDAIIPDQISEQEKTNDILFVSTLRFYKGIHLLMYVLDILRYKYNILPKATVIGVGEEMFNLIQTSAMLGLNVNFVGGVNNTEKFKLIKQSRVAVMPHFDEYIGTVFILEAMYCKVPVITWDLQINRERFKDTPVYVQKFDLMEMADKVYQTLKGEISFTLEDGKEFVKNNRTFNITAKQIEEILVRVKNESKI